MMMTKQQIAEAIFEMLSGPMSNPHTLRFHSDASLRDDLALDSSATLQLLVLLDVQCGLSVPEDALMREDFDTVRDLVELLHAAQERPRGHEHLAFDEDVKLHCVVSCLAEVLKRRQLDQRAIYFGVWDSEIAVDDQYVLSNHRPGIRHDFFFDWYQRLYGIEVESWYRPAATKDENAARLASLVESRVEGQHIMVMLDLYQLPERVNEFNKDPFPHYLMLGPTTKPDEWMVYDPDYRWEGITEKHRILHAMRQPSVAGGYVLTDHGAHEAAPQQIKAHFDVCFLPDRNVMTQAIRQTVSAHLDGRDRIGNELSLAQLPGALAEVPILSIRKYAYEHGFAFFFRALDIAEEEFDEWCEVIAELVKNFKVVQFHSLKLAATGDRRIANRIFELLQEQDERELRIKGRLHEVYQRWCREVLPPPTRTATPSEASS